jgi:beta-lactamase regulating signal transducer with metallopeptidase domain
MSELFLSVLNMSLTASYVIFFVILVRLLLKKAPKIISYALWGVVAFRLIIPFSFESMFSLMPRNTNTVPIPHDIIYQQSPQINSGIEVVDSFVGKSLPAPAIGASVNPLQIYIEIGAYIWVLGIIALLVYSLVSVLILKRQLKSAQLIEQNIFEAKNLKTPFVLGLIRPKIYLPVGLNATERSYILLHEQTHIHRKDHMIKIVAFLILSIHWFNPLVWIAFILMSADMELSCDERVLKEMNEDIKKSYANSLLSLATGRHILNGSPLAFGEENVKNRIKNVLNYKKPRFWVIAVALVAVIVVGVGLFTNPITAKPIDNSLTSQLLKNKTEYVGDNSKVGGIISLLMFPKNIAYDSFELLTNSEPFAIIVNLKTDTESRDLYSGEANQQQFQDNAVIMFALIGNVEYINFSIDDGLAPYSIQYTREWANHQYGKDVRDFARSKEEFSKLINDTSAIGKNTDIKKLVEDNLNIIMSSPKTSSSPQDYINAHNNEYENIFKYGGEDALQYMLTQFEVGNDEGLRGQIMMRLCKELLEARNNVTDESLSPQEWYNALDIRQEIVLPNYEYDGQDTIEKLVYDTEIERDSTSNKRGGFIIVAPKVFGSYEEEDMLKVFVTTYSARYKLFDNALSEEGGSIIPAAITYRKGDNGRYVLEKYEQARDGSEFGPSIREYCTMPVSGKEIKGLADKIFKHYTDYEDIRTLLYDNLFKHLKKNGITDATLTNSQGKIEFSMKDPKYKP